MVTLGLVYVALSGICNGLFSAPMKVIPRWKWENIWLVFILTSCVAMPPLLVFSRIPDVGAVLVDAPGRALLAALVFGGAWGFGAILFGLSVHHLGVSMANSLVIGLSAALGSLAPLIVLGQLRLDTKQRVLFAGIAVFLAGVWLCGRAGRLRDSRDAGGAPDQSSLRGYLFACGAGVMSAIFNVGYSLALPIADAGERLGLSRFDATNTIWLLMLGAGSIPNIAYCLYRLRRARTGGLFRDPQPSRTWGLSIVMGVLWGASIFLYGAATDLLGDIGPSIGWPLSLAVALLVANVLGILLKEWRVAPSRAIRSMQLGVALLFVAIVLCGVSGGL
jgi:L-rhamnose-H+ transport protein